MKNVNKADAVTITTLVENYIDILLADHDDVCRCGLIHHFDTKRTPVQAEFGISFLVEVLKGRETYRVLFDAGMTPAVIQHNLRALGIDAAQIDHIVISHGHPDHYGGLEGALTAIGHRVPVATHPEAFEPRYAVMPDGRVAPFYNYSFDRARLEPLGARFVLSRTAADIGPGIIISGEIQRETDFEGPRPPAGFAGLYQVIDSKYGYDRVMDEIALIINVRDQGLIVLTGCGHAGVINSIRHAQRLTGEERIGAVMGGFHLGFPGTPPEFLTKTVAALKEIEPQLVCPMHCSGLQTLATVMTEMPDAFFQYAVGTRLTITSSAAVAGDAKVRATAVARQVP
ncbi:MAG: MBL fold metallo-hydrolase [Acidobacteria bacterium]|nr:MBL fold metallo-hydrolase [Acidobacteriota bacterium]